MWKDYLYTLIWSMTPVVELRGSIPIGHLLFGLPLGHAVLVSILGGILLAAFNLLVLRYVIEFMRKIPFLRRIVETVLDKARREHSQRMARVGAIALVVLVAIPLPGSGAFTGGLVADIFKIPFRKALFLIGAGVILSALIVGLLVLFGNGMVEMLLPHPSVIEILPTS